ncbi:hypothetical protein [Aquimarina brevivitae]|uniref:Uncharacterized protein n=1 Tax=Aquimarina brevivitae TaxID=323412 RepID=A0A4Q7PIK5_9FLAO|nr:hypothetical protein [Aquimarina brevivitae]RZS99828.1 hypothetical protein EV197_1056 [Aquimarina brevivitae]
MKTPLMLISILLFYSSCSIFSLPSISNKEDINELETIITENLDSDLDVYSLYFESKTLTGGLDHISYDYKLKGSYFLESLDVSSQVLSDPSKKSKSAYQNKKTFKIKEASITCIPAIYEEALQVLKDHELYDQHKDYYLDSWVFRTNRKGEIYADFILNYFMDTSRGGRTSTTTYGQYEFTMNPDKSIKLNY